jgi:biopolymer transport protein ExbD
MAFKPQKKSNVRVELVSLIDMIFILLVFFLVTSFVIHMPLQERGLYIPTPENSLGRAQIVIQLIDENRVFWLDETSSSIIEEIETSYGYLSSDKLRDRVLNRLFRENTLSFDEARQRISRLNRQANQNPSAKYFVMIRSPNGIPFYMVMEIIANLSDTRYRNIRYGCVGGTFDDIKDCDRIFTVVEKDSGGRQRKNIRIDF